MSDAPPPGTAPPDGSPTPPPGPPPPALPALPPGPLAHDNLKANLYAAIVICWAIAAIFVGLRFYSRGVIIRVLGPSDWCILLALVFSTGEAVGCIDQTIHGSGSHLWDLDPTDYRAAMAWFRAAWYGVLMYQLSMWCSKMSILFLYIHIFAFKWARVGGQILLGIVVITNLFSVIATLTACIPLYHYWDFLAPREGVYCHPQSFWWANTGMHMVTDVLIFLLPMPVVWCIMLPLRQKLMLFGVFGCGFVVCFISILRLPRLKENQDRSFNTGVYYDFTYDAVQLAYLTSIELNGAIICACALTLKPLFARFIPSLLGGSGRSGSSGSPNGAVGNRRVNDSGMRGPPTIGSMPSKMPLSPADNELMGKVDGSNSRSNGSRTRSNGSYIEIDEWEVDVELAEGLRAKKDLVATGSSSSTKSESGQESERKEDEIKITEIKQDR